jgi:hypothetical protein
MWFVASLFGLPIIPFWDAVAISGLVSLLTFERIGEISEVQEAWIAVGRWSIGATVFFASAWLLHLMGLAS